MIIGRQGDDENDKCMETSFGGYWFELCYKSIVGIRASKDYTLLIAPSSTATDNLVDDARFKVLLIFFTQWILGIILTLFGILDFLTYLLTILEG
jgi:hypothetical protein